MKTNVIYYLSAIIIVIILNIGICFGQKNSLDNELNRLNTETTQIFGAEISQINWSKNSHKIYIKNQKNEVYSINLKEAKLTLGVWRKDTIGVISLDYLKKLSASQTLKYKATYGNNMELFDSIQTKSGTIVKFIYRGLSNGLIMHKKGEEEKLLWSSTSVCGGLIPSPNEKYVIYHCERSGLFLMKIE